VSCGDEEETPPPHDDIPTLMGHHGGSRKEGFRRGPVMVPATGPGATSFGRAPATGTVLPLGMSSTVPPHGPADGRGDWGAGDDE